MAKGNVALGAVFGAIAGVVAGVLTAPKSGKETREVAGTSGSGEPPVLSSGKPRQNSRRHSHPIQPQNT